MTASSSTLTVEQHYVIDCPDDCPEARSAAMVDQSQNAILDALSAVQSAMALVPAIAHIWQQDTAHPHAA